MKTTGGLAWPCGAPSRTLLGRTLAAPWPHPARPWRGRAALGSVRLTHGHHCAPAWQMAMDGIRRVVLHRRLCVLVFGAAHRRLRFSCARSSSRAQHPRLSRAGLLLFRQDEDVRLLPDSLLLRIQCAAPARELVRPGPALMRCHSRARRCNCSVDFLRGPRRDVRNFGLLRLLRLRAPHLREYQVGLTVATRSPTTGGASCVVGLMT